MKNIWRKFRGYDVTAATLTAVQVRIVSLPPTLNMNVTRIKQYTALKIYFRLKKSSAEKYMILQHVQLTPFPFRVFFLLLPLY